ncbi:unnamed protein product [Cylicocyclus nassatus]|uniref:Uncharacterized protein n=1 Tax=Cylicocyclus nassatus TaxID=53992 RepID=A0AA36MFD8_CYLNA|nr:unnamed protein product [Cylicocyclus nassatus]
MSFSAKVVQHSINQLLINTINDAERILLDLPQDGDRVEVITSSSHDYSETQPAKSKPYKTTYDVVEDKVLQTPSQKSRRKDDQISEDKGRTTSRSTGSTLSFTTSSQPSLRPYTKANKASSPSKFRRMSTPNKAEVVPGSIQVSPLRQMEGVAIDLVVLIKMQSGGSRTVNMQIECPRFVPKRIMIDGKWHDIV